MELDRSSREQDRSRLSRPRAGHERLTAVVACLLLASCLLAPARADELVISGDLSPGGAITLEARGAPGNPLLLWVGLGFADPPLLLKGQDFFIDLGQPWFLLVLGALPPGGELLLSAALPGDQVLVGLTLNFQSATAALSNGASIRMHVAGTQIAPAPAGANFGLPPLAGDLDGDGLGDYVVGARLEGGTGKVYIAYGPDPNPVQTLVDPTPQAGSEFGVALALGDFVGGPENDLLVGVHGAGPTSANATGEVWIFEGPSFASATQVLSPQPGPGNGFGIQIEGGDFDGDGFRDLAIGEAGAPVNGQPLAGKVQVLRGPSFTPWLTLIRPGNELLATGLFGSAIAAGDIDGDGLDDLVAAAPSAIVQGLPQVGEAWIWYGPLTGAPVMVRDMHPSAGAAFACRIELADLVGDARLDLISGIPGGAGTPPGFPGEVRVGEVQVFDGCDPAAGINFDDPTPELTTGDLSIPLGHFGFEVNAADVNGDGHLDLLVGANLADIAGHKDAGELFIYLGPTLAQRYELTHPAPSAGLDFATFADATDLDGDGAAELLVVSLGTAGDAGSVFVVKF